MDTEQYLDVFIDESMEHLDVLYNQLVELEKNPTEKMVIEEIFRAAHTIKGMSATMGFEDVAHLTHYIENVFDGIRYEKISVTAQIIDVLFSAIDKLNAMVEDISGGGDGKQDVQQIVTYLENIEKGIVNDELAVAVEEQTEISTNSLQTLTSIDEFEIAILNQSIEQGFLNYEISVELREDCLLKGARVFMVFEVLEQLGEVIKSEPSVNDLEEENFDRTFTVILVSKNNAEEIKKKINKVSEIESIIVNDFSVEEFRKKEQDTKASPVNGKKLETTSTDQSKQTKERRQASTSKTIRVNIDRLDNLMNLFEELVTDRGRLEQISLELDHTDLRETVERITRVSGDLQDVILNMRMVPVNHVFTRFPSMIRQLARDLNKLVNVEIVGGDTELDRTVIDEIGDPLVHLIRNAIDHGIESPEERISKGKSEQGTIKLQAYHSGNHVFIEIIDDGSGINKEKILNKAIENGIITSDQVDMLSDQQVYELIMESGFSTTEVISDISGRGVGLDVVKNAIEKLGGNISVDSTLGKGTVFSIELPLTLSIISVLLVELQAEKYAIPLSSVIETIIIRREEILSAHNNMVIDFRGKVVPLVFLNDVFAVPRHKEDDDLISSLRVRSGNIIDVLGLNRNIGQPEVVIKSLGNYLTNVGAISAATILRDGEVALIIDSNELIK